MASRFDYVIFDIIRRKITRTYIESKQSPAVSGGNIFSRMIRRHGQNFVSLDVCTYKGLPYIWLKTYFLSRRNPDRPEIVPTRQQFLFSVYDDLEDLFKFYKHCVLLNRSVLEKLKDMATTNLIKFARPMMSTVAAPTAISPEADKTTTEAAAAADRADRDEWLEKAQSNFFQNIFFDYCLNSCFFFLAL